MNGPLFVVGLIFCALAVWLALPGLRLMLRRAPQPPAPSRLALAHWSAVGGAAVFLTGVMYIIDANVTGFQQRQVVLLLRLLFMGAALVAGNLYFREVARIRTIQKEIREAEAELLNQPVSAGRLVNLAVLHREIGQYERARQVLQQALALEPALPDAHYQLGRLHAAAGEPALAAAAYRRALTTAAPGDAILQEIEAALREIHAEP